MPPAKVDLNVYQGDDLTFDTRFTNAGSPMNLTGWVFRAQVRPKNADTDAGAAALASFTCTIVSPPTGGVVRLHLPKAQSALLAMPLAAWDFEGEDPGGTLTTWLAGAVNITQEVTRT